ncbi:hypothetical protein [Sphingobacterium deserti]|uniref:Uncharacterized protein n=1 Tax=Sphingobacterium deserti TaxID=1229276 RepID=A0A0B8T1R7_9SPHI|nr:hypothetical protein [Sphingobacterium deserti]KGE15092.1 hypothetical protein DI53_1154 [Sphingobacterium deserti]
MNKLTKAVTLILFFSVNSTLLLAQNATIKGSLFDGTVVAGYVDKGAYINCTGPAVKYSRSGASILLGLLPSLKIKEDNVAEGSPRNALITPTLGFGITACIGHFALQLPAFYAAKTATTNGKWNLGVGIGYKF